MFEHVRATIRIFKPSGYVQCLFFSWWICIKLSKTAKYWWLICEFMYMNGKYKAKYQKKQACWPGISYISYALFKQEKALKRKHLQLVIMLLNSLHASKKNMHQKECLNFRTILRNASCCFIISWRVNDASSSYWESSHFLITSITKINPRCYSLIQRNAVSKTKIVLQNFLVFSCIEMLSPITYIRNNISCLSQSRWPIWFLIFLPLLWYCQFKGIILSLYSAITAPDQGFVLLSSCRGQN